jgi:hypothetical protein
MEHLENDMDDLFQKAGELYPLKTTGSDWDAVAGKLQNEGPGEVQDLSGLTAAPTRRRTWLLLLLLIPLGLGIFYYSGNQNQGHQNAVTAKPLNTAADQKKTTTVIPDKLQIPVGPADNNKTAASDNIQSSSGKKSSPENGSMNGTMSIKNKRLAYAAGGNQVTANNIPDSKKQISSADDKTPSALNSNNSTQGSKETGTAVANKSDKASTSTTESVAKAGVVAVPAAVSTGHETAATSNKTDKTEPSKQTSQDSSLAKKKTNTSSKQSKDSMSVYSLVGCDAVKFQSVNNLGFSLGALIGYRFNNRLSVETGLIWIKNIIIPMENIIKRWRITSSNLNAGWNCTCLKFRLVFVLISQPKNHGFFAKTGLSSYLMTSENYTFNYPTYPSVQWKNDSLRNNIFSILQISGGYERVISDKTKIRVEPYVKIPLQGIGKGDMPITSFGIYLGITHSFR